LRYFGLDVHKSYCEGAGLLPNNTIRRFRFPNEKKEWKRFTQELDGNCKVALEAFPTPTGSYWQRNATYKCLTS